MNVATTECMDGTQALLKELLAPHERVEVWPAGQRLFREGDAPAGVYVVYSGQVDLGYAVPRSGDTRPLFAARPGDMLGLACIVSNRSHDCSATTRSECITGFVGIGEFQRLLEEKPALWLSVLRTISRDIASCWDCMRTLR